MKVLRAAVVGGLVLALGSTAVASAMDGSGSGGVSRTATRWVGAADACSLLQGLVTSGIRVPAPAMTVYPQEIPFAGVVSGGVEGRVAASASTGVRHATGLPAASTRTAHPAARVSLSTLLGCPDAAAKP